MNPTDEPGYSINLKLARLYEAKGLSQNEVLKLVDEIAGEVSASADEAKEHKDYIKEAESYDQLASIWRQAAELLPAEWQFFTQSLSEYWENASIEVRVHAIREKEGKTALSKPSDSLLKLRIEAVESHRTSGKLSYRVEKNETRSVQTQGSTSSRIDELIKKLKIDERVENRSSLFPRDTRDTGEFKSQRKKKGGSEDTGEFQRPDLKGTNS